MSNYDAGHYFLTMLAPIRQGNVPLMPGEIGKSHVIAVRKALFGMATARQDSANISSPLDSPFSRVAGVHFARLFVLEDVRFNGRAPTNAVMNLLKGADLVQPDAVDHLPQGWLVMVLDMDAPDGSEASLRAATDRMWHAMEPELRAIFRHCEGFADDPETDAAAWFDYVRRCQVTTTMPFNDYWTEAPPPAPLARILWTAAGLIGALAIGLPLAGLWPVATGWLLLAAPLSFALFAVATILWLGTRPFPAAPDSDLDSILKALHVQDGFARFARDMQGSPPQDIHAAFTRFVAQVEPSRLDGPRQEPGRLPERLAQRGPA